MGSNPFDSEMISNGFKAHFSVELRRIDPGIEPHKFNAFVFNKSF